MRELLLLILNDLLAFPKYLDGLVKIFESNSPEDKENMR